MSECRTVSAPCEKILKEAEASGGCPEFSVCLPFGGRIYSEGGCVNYEEGTPPPDGVYSKVVIKNGCIVDVELADLPLYTNSPCAPVPAPCDCDGGGGSLPAPSTISGNLFAYDAAGRPLVLLSAKAGDGISVTGRGTADNPLIITAKPGESSGVQIRGTGLIRVEGTGTAEQPYRISHATVGNATTVMGMSFDDAGHMTGYTPSPESSTINAVSGGRGIDTETDLKTGLATIHLATPLHKAEGDYLLGGFTLSVDENNIIYEIKRTIDFTEGVYRLGSVDVTINKYGSITETVAVPPEIVSTSACRRYTDTDTVREITFTTDKVAAFHVVYRGNNLPTTTKAYVDGTEVAGILIPTASPSGFEAVTPALYSAGTHTVRIQAGSALPAGILSVTLTVAV